MNDSELFDFLASAEQRKIEEMSSGQFTGGISHVRITATFDFLTDYDNYCEKISSPDIVTIEDVAKLLKDNPEVVRDFVKNTQRC